MNIETRMFPGSLEVRESDVEGAIPQLVGYAAVWYRQDDPGTQFQLWPGVVERFSPESFAFDWGDVAILFNHDPNQPLGRTSAGTLTLETDDVGLRYINTPPNTVLGQQMVEMVRRGDVAGSSVAFQVAENGEEWEKVDDVSVRTITKVGLLRDVGPATFPAYLSTDATVTRDCYSRWAQAATDKSVHRNINRLRAMMCGS